MKSVELVTICMTDNRGRLVVRPIPKMQSNAGLREMIRRGDRPDECFAEMKRRNERVRAARAVFASEQQ